MPNFIYPQSEEDSAYLNQLNRGTDYATSAAERQGDRQADSTRRQGQIVGNALENAPESYMEGARFRSQQDTEDQTRQLRASEEGRASQRFVPEMEAAGLENKLRNENVNQAGIMTEEQLHQKDRRRGADTTSAKILGFGPDMSREDMEYAMAQRQGKANLGITNANIAGINQNTATGAYNLGKTKIDDMAGGLGPSSAPTGPAGAGGLSVSDMLTAPPSGAVSFTGGLPQVNSMGNAPKVAPTSSPDMSDADAAAIAERINKTTPGAQTTPEAVKASARHIQAQRQAMARQQTIEGEAQAVVTPDIAAARQKAGDTAANIGRLADIMEQNVKGYDKAGARGGTSITGKLANLAGWKTPGQHGITESGEQSRYRSEVVAQLRSMHLDQEADNIEGAGLAAVPNRMREGVAAAMRKSIGDLKATIVANGSLSEDRKIKDAVKAANMAIEKYNKEISGKSTVDITGGAHVSDAIMRGVQ